MSLGTFYRYEDFFKLDKEVGVELVDSYQTFRLLILPCLILNAAAFGFFDAPKMLQLRAAVSAKNQPTKNALIRFASAALATLCAYGLVVVLEKVGLNTHWSGAGVAVCLLSINAGAIISRRFEFSYDSFDDFYQDTILTYDNALSLLSGCVIFGYSVVILPMYHSSSTELRFLFCTVVHPTICAVLNSAYRLIEIRKMESHQRVVRNTMLQCFRKFFMALALRFMLLDLGSPATTISAILVVSIESILLRSTLVFVDKYFLRVFDIVSVSGPAVWMCESNIQTITDIFASLDSNTHSCTSITPSACV